MVKSWSPTGHPLPTELNAPPQQRHTAKRVFDRLIPERSMDNFSSDRLRDYIKRRKRRS